MAMSKVREDLAQTFLAALNQGQLPWRQCWSRALPVNAATGKNYRGINTLVLSYYADRQGYTDTRWCTYNQAQEKGWQVRKGSKGVRVEYWACYDTKEKKLLSWDDVRQKLKADPDYEKNLQLRCRTYTVFNAEQIDGIPAPEQRPATDVGALREKRDTLIRNMGVGYQEHGVRAYYSPGMDTVTLPPEATFDDTYSYMATFLHECGHASGHETRLNRDLTGLAGSESYAREELRAEIASAFTAQSIGLQLTDEQLQYQTEQHTAYIQSWAKILHDAPDELFRAIKDAETISDYLIEKGEFNMEQLFKAETVQQRKIVEWLVKQGITSEDVASAQLTGPAMVRITNPAGQYMDVYCGEDNAVRILDVTEDREAELQQLFWDETNEPETQDWREELTADETAMVEQWDLQTAKGFSQLATDILKQSTTPEQITVAIESTDDYTDANFHADLYNPEKQNPDGSYGTPVDYYRLVKIGDTGRIEVLDKDLVFPTKAQAEALATSIPYARLVDYDTLVHEAGKSLTAKYTLEEIPDSPDLRLRFHGYGKIAGYSSPEARPWQPQVDRIREIAIGKGITEIGRNVLNDYPALEKLTRPRSLQQTDPHALHSCPMLKEIKFTGAQPNYGPVHSPKDLLDLADKYPGFTVEQLDEIAAGIRDGLAAEQVAIYARREFDPLQMNALRYCVADGLAPEQLSLIANPAFNSVQMDIIRSGFQYGMTMEQVSTFASPEIPPQQMLDSYWEIRNDPDWVPALPAEPKEPPMEQVIDDPLAQAEREFWEMDTFLKKGGNIAELADWYEKDLDFEP